MLGGATDITLPRVEHILNYIKEFIFSVSRNALISVSDSNHHLNWHVAQQSL
jgi:hypothetical protein